MLICAKDGWLDIWSEGIAPRQWSYRAIKKYSSIDVFCLSDDMKVYVFTPIHQFNSRLHELLSWLMNSKLRIEVEFKESPESDIRDFVSVIEESLKSEGDFLTQVKSKQEILDLLHTVESYEGLKNVYNACGWA